MKAQIKEVKYQDGCKVELRLPAGHILNPHQETLVRTFYANDFGYSRIWEFGKKSAEEQEKQKYPEQSKWVQYIPDLDYIYEELKTSGDTQLEFDTQKEKLIDVIRREYRQAYPSAMKG